MSRSHSNVFFAAACLLAGCVGQGVLIALPFLNAPPYLAFYPAVMVTAIYGSEAAGFAVAAGSAVAPHVFHHFMPSFWDSIPDIGTVIIFFFLSSLVVWLGSSARRPLREGQELNRTLAAIVESSDDAIFS